MKLTLRGLAHRAIWELDGRSGFKALRTPRGAVPIPSSVPPFGEWWDELPSDHRLRQVRRPTTSAAVAPQSLDWHLEPHTGARWPRDEHWTRATAAGMGDLRSTWEFNRFGHVWTWIAEGRDGSVEFERQVLDWRSSNPFRAGVNWASGQELAVRALAWLAGAAAWGPRMTGAGWQSLVELLYWHGVQIAAEFGFAAHTVRNNHVIAEALGLAAIADAFPGFDESEGWRTLALDAFVVAVREQFFDDGGYCQHSHAYHAYALGLLFEAEDWFAELKPVLTPIYRRSLQYFAAIVEPGDRAPNYGPNDRAQVTDYGALLLELSRRSGRARPEVRSATFPDAGLHVLRGDGVSATLRCGPLSRRAGHDDALNLEVWLGGEPVAIDAGSYRYLSAEHQYYTGAHSHNVVLVARRGPRHLATRFTWSEGPDPTLVEFDARRGLMTAAYDGHPGTRWERQVLLGGGAVDVIDTVNPTGEPRFRTFTVQWLIDAAPSEVVVEGGESFTWNIRTPRALITISVEPLIGGLEGAQAGAWAAPISRVYGTQETATRVELTTGGRAIRFRTRFSPR